MIRHPSQASVEWRVKVVTHSDPRQHGELLQTALNELCSDGFLLASMETIPTAVPGLIATRLLGQRPLRTPADLEYAQRETQPDMGEAAPEGMTESWKLVRRSPRPSSELKKTLLPAGRKEVVYTYKDLNEYKTVSFPTMRAAVEQLRKDLRNPGGGDVPLPVSIAHFDYYDADTFSQLLSLFK